MPAREAGPPRGRRLRSLRLAALAVAFVVASGLLGYLVHSIARDLTISWVRTGLSPFMPSGSLGPLITPPPGATPLPQLPPVQAEPWSGDERVTVLVMGLDYRDWAAGQGASRTDSMMLFTFDPITRHAGMLSIPRDLWVDIPGFGHHRINTAFVLGENNRLPGGGAGLAMSTVESVVGVPIQYYVVLEFAAFERMIDEIGGIDVLVTEPIRIAPIGRPSMQLEAKAYHFDGAQALAYARFRRDSQGDFGRGRRQQQVALAILDRVTDLDLVPTLVARAPALFQELSSGIRTNMTLEQMVSLGWLAVQIPEENIRSGGIGPPNMVQFYTMPDGAAVLRPVPDQIRILRNQIFAETSAYGPSVSTAP